VLSWMADNAEWLFSGLGVTLLIGLFCLIRWLVRRTGSQGPVESNTYPTESKSSKSSAAQSRIELDFPKIDREISALAPFQRKNARDQYKGVRTIFTGTLATAQAAEGGEILLALSPLSDHGHLLVFMNVPSEDNPQLRFAKEGTVITIEGEVEMITDLNVCLADVSILDYSYQE